MIIDVIIINASAALAPQDEPQLTGFIRSVLGLMFQMLCEWHDARREFIHAMVAFRAGGDGENTAAMLHNLAVVEIERGRTRLGMRLLRRSLRINQVLQSWTGVANDFRRLAVYAADAGSVDNARTLLLRARRAARRAGELALETLCELDLGRVAITANDPRETLRRTSVALKLAKDVGDPFLLYEILVARGIGWQRRGRLKQAVDTFTSALAVLERFRDGAVTEDLTLRFFAEESDVHRALVEISMARGDLRAAWEWAERTRGRELNRRIRRSTSMMPREMPPHLVAREHDLLRALDSALTVLDAEADATAAENVDVTTRELHEVWNAMRSFDPEYVALRTGEPMACADVRRELAAWSEGLRA